MTRLIRICLVLLIFVSVTVPCAEARFEKYLSLISDVQKHYQSASVCLLLPHKDRPSHEFSLAYNLTRYLSRKHIGTVMIRYNETMKLMDSYGKEHRRPLLVVLLRSVKDVDDFSQGVQNIKISYPIWLVIFANEFDTPICEYCNRPMGNKFGLRFDTQMLILCCKYPIIKEWWTLGDNETQVGNFGRWTVGNRFQVVVNKNLYKRRNHLGGIKLRVAMKESDCEDENNDTPKEFTLAVLKELKSVMNFTLTFVCKNFEEALWTEALMYVGKGQADFLIGRTSIRAEQSKIVDFTLPLEEKKMVLVVKDIDSSSYQMSTYFEVFWYMLRNVKKLIKFGHNALQHQVQKQNYFRNSLPPTYRVFTYPVWLVIICVIIITAALLAIIEMKKGENSFLQNFFTNNLNVWGIFCSQGLPVFPADTPRRIIYYTIYLTAIIVLASYSGLLTSFRAVSISDLPFSNVEEFIKDGSYEVIMWKYGEPAKILRGIHSSTTLMKLKAMMRPAHRLPVTRTELWKQVCNEKVAAISHTKYWNLVIKNTLRCKIRTFDIGVADKIAIAMPPGNQYTGLVNFYLRAFQEKGIMKRLKNKYNIEEQDVSIKPVEVSAKDVAPLFLILAGGMVLALLILVLEKLYAPFRKSQLEKRRRKAILERSYWRRRVIERKKRRRSLWRRLLRL